MKKIEQIVDDLLDFREAVDDTCSALASAFKRAGLKVDAVGTLYSTGTIKVLIHPDIIHSDRKDLSGEYLRAFIGDFDVEEGSEAIPSTYIFRCIADDFRNLAVAYGVPCHVSQIVIHHVFRDRLFRRVVPGFGARYIIHIPPALPVMFLEE